MSLSALDEDASFHTIRLGHHHTTNNLSHFYSSTKHAQDKTTKGFPIIKSDVTVNNTSPPGFDFFKNRAKDEPNRRVEAKSGVTTHDCLHAYLQHARK